jgi:hypothetical protein
VRGRGGFGPGLGFSGGLTERKKSCGVEFFPGRGTPVGWAAFPAGNGLTEQGHSGCAMPTLVDPHAHQRGHLTTGEVAAGQLSRPRSMSRKRGEGSVCKSLGLFSLLYYLLQAQVQSSANCLYLKKKISVKLTFRIRLGVNESIETTGTVVVFLTRIMEKLTES